MNRQQKLKEMYNKLRSVGAVHTQTEFAEKIGYARSNVSRAMNGDTRYLSDNLFKAIERAFPDVFGVDVESDIENPSTGLYASKYKPEADFIDKVDLGKILSDTIGSKEEILKLKDEITDWQRRFFMLEADYKILQNNLDAANDEIERLKGKIAAYELDSVTSAAGARKDA